MKILICGGHLTPALAIINALPKNTQLLYVGREYALEGDSAISLEYQTITKRGIPFITIQTGRLQRTLTRYTLSSLARVPKGFAQAFSIVTSFSPDIIVGFGGYVSVPVCFAGYLRKIPIIIHEQTLEAGLANRILAPLATKICISWTASKKYFPPAKTVLTGNPSIEPLFKIKNQKTHSKVKPTIVVVGGSQGSHAINQLIEKSLSKLLKKYYVFHQTGDAKEFGDFDRLTKTKHALAKQLQEQYTLVKFVEPQDIGGIFHNATLVVTRAGINTINALLVLNKPALVIPLPITQRQEQRKNALLLKSYGLCEVVSQELLTPDKFTSLIDAMVTNIHAYTNKKEEQTLNTTPVENMLKIIIDETKHRRKTSD